MFVAMGLSAVFPVLHGMEIYGIQEMRGRIGLTWLVLQGFLYILGAGLYAVSFQSDHMTGIRLTNAGSLAGAVFAWLFRHLGKLASDLSRSGRHGCCVTFVWPSQGFRLPSWTWRLQMLGIEAY